MNQKLIPALRQFKHNDGSEGFVNAYDMEIVDREFAALSAPTIPVRTLPISTWQERCDWKSSQPAAKLIVLAMKEEIADLRAALNPVLTEERIEMWINGIGGGVWSDGKLTLRRDELEAVIRGIATLASRMGGITSKASAETAAPGASTEDGQ